MSVKINAKLEFGRLSISHNQANVPRETKEPSPWAENLSSSELELIELSDNSKRKMRRRISALMLKQLERFKYSRTREKDIKNNTAFITLTLSDWQKHDDKYIKSKMLNNFLTQLRKRFQGISYIWKAEKQGNGNIHFHIIATEFVDWKWVRKVWNKIQLKHGYIKRYATEFGNTDPNSIDVEGLRHVKDCMSYMYKYVSKELDGHMIEGRIWGCSNDIVDKGSIDILIDKEFIEMLENGVNFKAYKKFVNDYCTVYTFPDLDPFETYRPAAWEWLLSCIAHE